MEFDEILAQVLYLLQREKRVSYRALQRRFHLDDDTLEALKDELIEAKQQATDENGKVLVWTGSADTEAEGIIEAQSAGRSAQEDPLARAVSPAPERRHLTVMFSDIVDSTALSGRLDPEDYREIVRAYQTTCAAAITRFDGHIAQYLGDSLLVYFGYPQAHEDDPQRAIHAGLAILAAVRELNARLVQQYGEELSVRIGIHTGLVIVGEVGGEGRQELLAMGRAPNVAARIQAVAASDCIAISAATYRLIQGYFVCQDLGRHTLKGLAEPVQVYRVLQESTAHSRFEVATAGGLTPLVGREAETALLLRSWEQSKEGQGSVILLGGEGGIGKSRLVEGLRDQVIRDGGMTVMFHSSPYHINSAFHAVVECLQRLMQWHHEDTSKEKLNKLERLLQGTRLPLHETVPLFASLLSVALPAERYPSLDLSPQRHKQQTQAALVAWLLGKAAAQPLLVVWEDLQWADPSTQELLGLMIDQVPTARLLVVLTCRSEFRSPWGTRSHLTQIMLQRLERRQIGQMVGYLTKGKGLPPEVLEQVIVKTDGVPLFVEELVKMLSESGFVREEGDRYVLTGPLPQLAIPATLQDSLMARLDRLQTAREVVQLGATLGRTFAYELIRVASQLDEETLQQELRRLVEAELLYQQGLPPQATYVFKHALIQETAYQSLVRSTRQRYHRQIAEALSTQFPESVYMQPELLAHHYTEAGLAAHAVPYWQQAAERAIEQSANVESIHHLTMGLKVLMTLPETPTRARNELTLQLMLGPQLAMIQGHSAPEVEQAYARAQALGQQVGDSPQHFSALLGLWRFYMARADFRTARDFGEQSFGIAEGLQEPGFLHEAHLILGATLFYLGELVSAHTHLQQSMALYDPWRSRSLTTSRTSDPGVMCLVWEAWSLWLLGYPEQALARSHEALALARDLDHTYSRCFALYMGSTLHMWRCEPSLVEEKVTAVMALSHEHGFVRWLGGGLVKQGWMRVERGEVEEGIRQMQQGVEAWRAMGGQGLPGNLARLAEAYRQGGRAEEGLRVVREAMAVVERTAERYYHAELCRLEGELLLQQSHANMPLAQASLQQAFDIACRQQAKSWELRAAMSLSRLLQRQGQRTDAYQVLASTYDWFSEGFDTRDLRDAKALLEALA